MAYTPTRSPFLAVINKVLPCQVLVNIKAKKLSHLDKFNWLSFNAEIFIYARTHKTLTDPVLLKSIDFVLDGLTDN